MSKTVDPTKPMRLVGTHEPVTFVKRDSEGFSVKIPGDNINRWFLFNGLRGHREGRTARLYIQVENTPEMIDITKPLEAVETKTGRIVPVTFHKMDTHDKSMFSTKECPCSATTNTNWMLTGEDRCNEKLWTIRNVAGAVAPLDLKRPLMLRDGGIVTLLASNAAAPNPLVFQTLDGTVFARPMSGRALPDKELPIDVINQDVKSSDFMTLSTRLKTLAFHKDGSKLNLSPDGVLLEVHRLNGKITDITYVRSGPNA